jgi:hypothetical protein
MIIRFVFELQTRFETTLIIAWFMMTPSGNLEDPDF